MPTTTPGIALVMPVMVSMLALVITELMSFSFCMVMVNGARFAAEGHILNGSNKVCN